MRRLLIAAAGTGGHVMPGLAVAEAMRARGWTVDWIGTRAGMERGLVERSGIGFAALDFSGLRGGGPARMLAGGWRLLAATVRSLRLLRRQRPDVLFTTGGYVAVPVGLAAALLRVPIAFLNADAAPQLSLRLLRRLCARVLCGFDGAAARLAGAAAVVSGAPVRAEIAALAPPAQRHAGRSGPLNLLVLGGSLGAASLNELLPGALALLPPPQRPRVVHQCGRAHEAPTGAAYVRAGVQAEVLGFIDDVAHRYAEADLVLCRAGAITVSELCVAGVAAILVPLVVSTTDHQRSNAEWMAAQGAALHVPQAGLDAAGLARVLAALARPQLVELAQRARALGRPQAGATVVAQLEALAVARTTGPTT